MDRKVAEILAEIERNTEDGAATLAGRALDALEVASGTLPTKPDRARDVVFHIARKAMEIRPAMGAIGTQALLACERARALVSAHEISGWEEALKRAVSIERARSKEADLAIAALAKEEIGLVGTLATCSYSSTVQRVLNSVSPTHVIIGEGHPLGDGVRGAEAAAARGYEAKLTSDTALPTTVEEADAVLLGADQVLFDGAVVNRSASFPLALAARHFGKPVYVVCQRIKITGISGEALRIEACPGAFEDLTPGIMGHAPLFDVTPAALIEKTITDVGVLTEDMTRKLSEDTARLRKEILEL